MLSKKIATALNEQIAKEAYASNYYLAMASWCENQGLRGSAAFLYEQSEEERVHMKKLFKFVNEARGHAKVPSLKEPPAEYKSIQHVFELSLEHEENVTKSINQLVDLSLKEKDYATFNFLQWYVSEQHEEEQLFTSILDIISLTGLDGKGVFLIDRDIENIRGEEEEEGGED